MSMREAARPLAIRCMRGLRRVWPMLWMLFVAVGCALLPDLHALRGRTQMSDQSPVVGQQGALSAQQAAGVLAELRRGANTTLLEHHLELMQRINSAPLTVGNASRLLIDGPAAHAAMFAAIAAARDHVNLQTYIFEADEVGEKLAELLLKKSAQGVQVNVLYDSVGSMRSPPEFFDRLREGHVAVCEFNPVNPLKAKKINLNHRDHRKLLVTDGTLAYTGGINISAVYSSSSTSRARKSIKRDGWRDTQIEVKGPAVGELQKLFFRTWESQRCPQRVERFYFPTLTRAGDRVLRVIGSTPEDSLNLIYVEMLSAITNARKSIYITMAYFVPDPQTLDALRTKARQGVDTVLILPGVSDFSVAFHAGRSHYDELLEAGVRIYERNDALLHAKTAVIDGVWSTVGSANMDWRSFLHNDELNVVILGEDFGREMQHMFQMDLDAATPIDRESWSRRGPLLRLQELVARLWEYWL
jgi:cardiolipin synthase